MCLARNAVGETKYYIGATKGKWKRCFNNHITKNTSCLPGRYRKKITADEYKQVLSETLYFLIYSMKHVRVVQQECRKWNQQAEFKS